MSKIKVCYSIEELNTFLSEINKNKYICLYLANKKENEWDVSTSRIYMNKINENFIYLPVNIEKENLNAIRNVYEIAENNKQIIAINQTQPHKSNLVLKEYFKNQNIPINVDSLVKNSAGKLICYNLNGSAFVNWLEGEVEQLQNKNIVIFGVGGVGEPIAREIVIKKPTKMYLIDINSKEKLVNELLAQNNLDIKYFKNLNEFNLYNDNFILINCAGKEGNNDRNIQKLLENQQHKNNVFIDLRPQLNIDIVNIAKRFGWNAYTGYGMNTRNDYVLLKKINERMNIKIPTFQEFSKLVKKAS